MKNIKRTLENFLKKHDNLRLLARKVHYDSRQKWYSKLAEKHPIEEKLILFESFMGRQYACNPRAIYEDILSDERFRDYTLVWAFKNHEEKAMLPEMEKALCVEYKSAEYYEYCARAKYIITNSSLDFAISPKEEQIIVQTWHGTPLKRLRCDIEAEFGNANNSLEEIYWKNDVDTIRYDYFLSPSAFASEKFTTAFRLKELNKQNILVETGYPRNDFLSRYTEEDVLKIKRQLGIEHSDKKIILYAPTFRENQHQAGLGYVYKTEVDFDRLQRELGDEYIILFRPHYFVANQFDFEKYAGFVYNVTEIDDVKELYIITDLLITDYSSVFFDYGVLKRPVVFYMYDLEEYAEDIRGFYMNLDQLPGDIVQTEDQLIEKIKEGNFAYDDRYEAFNHTFNYLEDGHAGERLIDQVFFQKEDGDTKPDVVVLSRNYSTGLGIIRSLGEAGYNVDLVASTKKKGSSVIASCSKYVRTSVEVQTPDIQATSGDELIRALLEIARTYKEKAILFPTDDFTASVVDVHKDILKEYFVMSEIKNEEGLDLAGAMDKTCQSRMAEEAGLAVPQEWIIPLQKAVSVPEDVVYPCFVKPLKSIAGHKTEMAVCTDRQELETHLRGMQQRNMERSVLVQEYLQIDKEYAFSGVCLGQTSVIPAVIEKTAIAEYERGVAISGKMMPISVLGNAEEGIRRLLKKFNYTGMFDMDLNVCDGKIYFGEINFRSGGSNYAYCLNGVNLPDIFIKEIRGLGHSLQDEQMNSYGKTFVYEKVAWEDYIYSYKTKAQLKQILKSADYTLLQNETDPEPGKTFNRRIRLSAMKQKTKQKLKKNKAPAAEQELRKNISEVVVAGRNYCNILTMTRDLGEAGYGVHVLRIHKNAPKKTSPLAKLKPDACSRYVVGFHECVVKNDMERVYKQLIAMAKPDSKMLLMPVDDYSAYVVDLYYEELSPYYVMPSVNQKAGEIIRLMDKNAQKKEAAKFNVPMLQSHLVKIENGEFEWNEQINFPCFIKPNTSMKGTKSEMAKCDNRESLEKLLKTYAAKGDAEFIVEDFADIKNEFSLIGLSVPGAVAIPGVFKVLAGGHKERTGVSISGETVPAEPFEEIIETCSTLVKGLNYTGLFDIDLIETRGGDIYFIELNFRSGASARVFSGSGINLPGLYADFLLKGKSISEGIRMPETGKRFLSEKVLLEEYVRSDVSRREIRNYIKNTDVFFIKDDTDPEPYEHFSKIFKAAGLLRVPYKCRDIIRKH